MRSLVVALAGLGFAACTSALFLGSLFSLNMTGMKTIRTAKEAASASQVLQQRVEAMRIANWHQITDGNWLASNVLNANAAGADGLNNMSETLTLTPYDNSANTSSTQITRSNGTATVTTNSNTLLAENAVKAVWTVSYSGGINSKATTRQTVAIIAKGGVAKW